MYFPSFGHLKNEIDTLVSDLKLFNFDQLELGGKIKNYKYNRWLGAQNLSIDTHLILLLYTLADIGSNR